MAKLRCWMCQANWLIIPIPHHKACATNCAGHGMLDTKLQLWTKMKTGMGATVYVHSGLCEWRAVNEKHWQIVGLEKAAEA